jgi:DNA-binding HxlR family transcriptional regulator
MKNKAARFRVVNGRIFGVTPSASSEPVKADSPVLDCAGAASSCDEALVRAFRFLGKRWSGVILGTLVNGSLGFAELGRRVEGISDSVLAERLSELQALGLIVRDVQIGPPVSVTYTLSTSGTALMPAMRELTVWATNNLPRQA